MGKFNTKILLALTAFAVTTHLNLIPAVAYAEEIVEDVPPTTSSVVVDDAQTPTIEDSSIVEGTPDNQESVENSANNEVKTEEEKEPEKAVEHDFEDFLAWAETEAEKYGYGDEFSKAVEAIKTAATQEQVTLSTIGSIGVMVAVLAYTLYKKVTDAKFKTEVNKLSASVTAQLEKLKELVDGTNNNTKTEEEIKAEEQALKAEAICTKEALAHLINAFMHFSSHVGMSNVNKEEVQRDCMNALKCIDGEVTLNESNEK